MRPLPPALVLAVALALPGVGLVLNREPLRGLIFAFFALLLGTFTVVTADPSVSWAGKLSGGLFVHALAVLDAYKRARIRDETLRAAGRS